MRDMVSPKIFGRPMGLHVKVFQDLLLPPRNAEIWPCLTAQKNPAYATAIAISEICTRTSILGTSISGTFIIALRDADL